LALKQKPEVINNSMISHEYRCIFIHLPRTGGTSIEKALCGKNWWDVDPSTKHLIASQAREVYKDYWDAYFKFSIVREPCSRMLSCLRFPEYFSINYLSTSTYSDFLRGYMQRFGYPLTVEYDHRFHKPVQSKRALPNAVYLNALDEELDYIGRFEKLDEEFSNIAKMLGAEDLTLEHFGASPTKPTDNFTCPESLVLIKKLFQHDFEHFGYKLPDS